MPSNKDRLQLCLYARGGGSKMPGGEDKYHWALLVAPKTVQENSPGIIFHVREKIRPSGKTSDFYYEEVSIDDVYYSSTMLRVRITIAKVENIEHVRQIVKSVPIRRHEEAGWNCISWVKEALEMLDKDDKALGTRILEWDQVKDSAIAYCEKKIASHRFDGKGEFKDIDLRRPPTFDLLEDREVLP